jgi:hypothetical protein
MEVMKTRDGAFTSGLLLAAALLGLCLVLVTQMKDIQSKE